MSKCYPDAIPQAYADNEELTDAYRMGWNHGHGIACHNVPTMGDNIWTESMGHVTVDAENIREIHADFCYAAESNSRQYSPFEFTAHEFNEHGEGDDSSVSANELWEAFEEGVNDSISADLAEYTDEDYGIESDDEESE